MEMGSIEKKMKTNNSRFIYYLLNHEIILDYILQTDLDWLKWQALWWLLQCHNSNCVAKLFLVKNMWVTVSSVGNSFWL